jgi:eukaryotic-like serine/threonine-protein kinase
MPNEVSDSQIDPSLDPNENEVIQAVKQYMQLLESGNAPLIDQFVAQYPHISGQLQIALEGLAMVHHGGDGPLMSSPLIPNASPAANQTMGLPNGFQPTDKEFTGKPIGDFQIVSEIGRGGMGVVYEAIQLSLNRRVALKVLPFASGLDKVRLQRFRNEAHAAAQLHHSNIVPVYAVGSERGVHYYAMQLIDGSTLAELIERMRSARKNSSSENPAGAKPKTDSIEEDHKAKSLNSKNNTRAGNPSIKQLDETFRAASSTMIRSNSSNSRYIESMVEMTVQAAQALQHAHQYGVIHRDIKPGNLLIDQTGKIWVTDFGLAQIQHADTQLTRSGDHIGTLRYMSPEQAIGDRDVMDHRSDIYSLGVTLYELLTLEPAIRGENYREMLNHVAEQEPVAPRLVNASIPQDLDTIIRKAISKEPSQRYTTAQTLADDLQRWLDNKPISAKPPTAWQRIAKWRKRNSMLVNMAAVLMALMSVGLLATTLIVLRQQSETQQALDREIEQRNQAQQNFQQARAAVDTFSQLSESELAFRPEVQTLRKKILETSLEFYRSFLAQRHDDSVVSQELQTVSEKVERILGDLKLIQESGLLLMLSDSRVLNDLKIDEASATELREVIADYQNQQNSQLDFGDLQYAASSESSIERMHQFVSATKTRLSESQLNRLQQIAWQLEIPFTFLSDEMVELLKLTPVQRQSIGRIIAEHRPGPEMFRQGRGGGPGGPAGIGQGGGRDGGPGANNRGPSANNRDPRFGEDQNHQQPPDRFGERRPNEFGGPERGQPERGQPDRSHGFGDFRGGPMGKDDMKGHRDPRMQIVKQQTVDHILKDALNESQRLVWEQLIGPAFQAIP